MQKKSVQGYRIVKNKHLNSHQKSNKRNNYPRGLAQNP